MKIRPLGAELFHADGQTDMTTVIVVYRTLRTFLKCNRNCCINTAVTRK